MSDEEDRPGLSRRRRRFKLPEKELMTIFMLVVALVAVLYMRRGCSEGVASLFRTFEPPRDATTDTRP